MRIWKTAFKNMKNYKEYVIWGIAPDTESEDLLVSEQAGIKTREAAKRAVALLEEKHGCRNCRIQVLDFGEPLNWNAAEMVNL